MFRRGDGICQDTEQEEHINSFVRIEWRMFGVLRTAKWRLQKVDDKRSGMSSKGVRLHSVGDERCWRMGSRGQRERKSRECLYIPGPLQVQVLSSQILSRSKPASKHPDLH